MASIKVSTAMSSDSRPSVSAGDLLVRSALRGVKFAAASKPSNFGFVQPSSL